METTRKQKRESFRLHSLIADVYKHMGQEKGGVGDNDRTRSCKLYDSLAAKARESDSKVGAKTKTHPAKNAATVKVAYKAEFEFEFTFESTLPAAPNPFKALNDPGHMKQTNPRRHT
jgi:hypothetical protein